MAKQQPPRDEETVARVMDDAVFMVAAQQLYRQVGDELDRVIRSRKMSRTAAAKLFGRPESFIAERVRGRNMTLRSLAEIAETLGADITITLKTRK